MTEISKRVILIVLDSVGIGELPDARLYQDQGSDTLGNIARSLNNLSLPNLEKLGLAKIARLGHDDQGVAIGCYGKMKESSPGKDTTTGHWEIAGVVLSQPFPLYPHGFPPELIREFEKRIGLKVLGNIAASGTEIIKELGEEHLRTGSPIVYTSADSVFQIACHEEKFGLQALYLICQIARDLLQGKHAVGRVIARPFVGVTKDTFKRTANRHDYSLLPLSLTVLDVLKQAKYNIIGIGKIEDIFAARGLTESIHTKSNKEGIDTIIATMQNAAGDSGLIFANLLDFDMLYGHRNDVLGYARALEEADGRVPEIINELQENDLLIITADHGCDPTTVSTDHSREYVPLLVYGRGLKQNIDLGIRKMFADVGQTIAEYFEVGPLANGSSFLKQIQKR